MSYLRRPRVHFSGKMVVRVATANNTATTYDGRTYFDVANVTLDVGADPENFREWMHLRNPEGYINALWDYYGDNHVRFESARIHAAELENGSLNSVLASDSVLGAQVQISGHPYNGRRTSAYLVDTDPTDAFTTQLFSDVFSIRHDEGVLLEATGATRAYARWLNYWRNLSVDGDEGSSAWWQIALPKTGLKWGALDGSAALQELRQAAQKGQGLVVRCCTYLFRHPSYREISRQFQEGQRGAVEGVLMLVGTIGVWDEGELASTPPARLLAPSLENPVEIPSALQSQRKDAQFYLGATLAHVDTHRHCITLDLVNTFSETTVYDSLSAEATPQHAPEKIDLGTLTLGIQEHCSPETCRPIATLPYASYQRERYWRTVGLVEIPYLPELEPQILNGDLVLFGTPGKPLLTETPYTAMTDQHSVYLDLEEIKPQTISAQILRRGVPAPAGLTVSLSQTVNQKAVSARGGSLPTPAPDRIPHTRFQPFQRARLGAEVVLIPQTVKTEPHGIVQLTVAPLAAGTCKVWFNLPDGIPIDSVKTDQARYFLRGGLGEYLNVRVLPDDRRYDRITDAELNWDFVHREVFAYYSMLYPAMNRFVDLDNEEWMRAYAATIKTLVSEKLRDSTAYMPVTRELSAGKRRLIQRWADLQTKK